MVGLSVVLEVGSNSSKKSPQVISKSSMMIRPSASSTTFNGRKCCDLGSFSASDDFLQYCFLCKQKLLPGKDIYMYKGDRAFCSEECRCRQILMDEEESLAAIIKPRQPTAAAQSSTSNYSSPCHKRAQKST